MRDVDEDIWHSWERHLLAENKSKDTIGGYRQAVSLLSDALPGGTDLYAATADHITAWLADGHDGRLIDEDGSPVRAWAGSTQATYARRVRTFYTWAVDREWIDQHPMRTIGRIREEEKEIPIPPAEDVIALIESIRADGKVRSGNPDKRRGDDRPFRARRDLAIIGILCEPGSPRATELASILRGSVDIRHDRYQIMGKGRRERTIPYGDVTATALGLYLRARGKHKFAARPELFIGRRGPLTRWGVAEIVADRCKAAGITHIHPHAFRHMTAHQWFAAGGSEGDAMQLFGWKSETMTRRYAASAAAERAQNHARQMSLGDKLLSGKTAG